jgi:hypothetical protein
MFDGKDWITIPSSRFLGAMSGQGRRWILQPCKALKLLTFPTK